MAGLFILYVLTTVSAQSGFKSGYNVDLGSWLSPNESIKIPHSEACWSWRRPGETVTVMEKIGSLGIHWIAGIAESSH
jgi:hypothetical protein